jgi:hypothetical protein
VQLPDGTIVTSITSRFMHVEAIMKQVGASQPLSLLLKHRGGETAND